MKGYLGATIINGQLKYASVSSVKTFDPRTRAGCPRRWHKRYVGRQREPESENMIVAKAAGLALDKEMKHYLLTGEKNLSALAIKGLHIMEQPGPGLSVDIQIHTLQYFLNGQPFAPLPDPEDGTQAKYPEGTQVVISSELSAAGIPFVGELDIAHSRGHYRDDDGEYHDDPPGTVEVADLKFKSNAKDRDGNSTFMMATDLARDIQMAGYGEWVGRVRPSATHVRLSHLYFPKRPASVLPTKVTRLHVLDDCRRTWEHVEGLVRSMTDVAKEPDIEKVPGADRSLSCDAYGGCPYRETCSVYKRSSLDSLFEKVAEDHLQEKQKMGLIANTQPQLMQQATTQQGLASEEQAMRAQVAQQQAQMPVQLNLTEYLQVCQRLGSYGFGMPSLAGNAAQAYAAAGGQSVAPGFVYQGLMAPPGAQYSLHGVTAVEPAQVYQLEREAASRMTPAPQYAPVATPPTMPAFTQQVAAAYNAGAQVAAAVPNFLSPGAPESMPALAQQQAAPPTAEAPAEKKKGRPKKAAADSGTAPEGTAAVAAPTPPSSPVSVPAPQAPPVTAPTYPAGILSGAALQMEARGAPTPAGALMAQLDSACPVETEAGWGSVLINARFANKATKSLAGYVDYINGELAKRYSVLADGTPGIQDVRCVPKDSPLAFGGWKGAVREVVKADPPPQGDYHLDTHMCELNEAVADALRVVAERNGWLYVRGVR